MKKLSLLLVILTLFTIACQKDVQPRPTADFTYSLVSSTNTQQVYQFTNTSKNADRFQWVTSGSVANTDKNIMLTYTENGRKLVSLTAKNDVGEDSKTQNIDIAGLATTGDLIFWSQIGDKGDITVTVNNVVQGKITKYINNGSTPECGLQGFVTVTLPPGTYNYQAVSSSLISLKWQGTITIVRGACSKFQLTR